MIKSKNHKPKTLVRSIQSSFLSLNFQKKHASGNTLTSTDRYYPKFAYVTNELSAFTYSIDVFLILLKEGRVVNYESVNAYTFHKWLIQNNVRDLEEGNFW